MTKRRRNKSGTTWSPKTKVPSGAWTRPMKLDLRQRRKNDEKEPRHHLSALSALGSKGLVALQTPGNVPYDLTAKSLNESVAKIGEDNTIIPVKTGQVDILADVTVGDIKETASRRISVVTQADLERMAYNAT